LRNKALKLLVVGIVNIAIILLVLEIGLRIYSSFALLYDLEMHKYAVELKRESSTPGLTHEHIPNSEAYLMGVAFKINSLGFRDSEISAAKGNNEYRIMTLGCSNGVGWGVPHDSVFTELLESTFNSSRGNLHYSVINAGVGNYNTVMERLQLQEKFKGVSPDMVLVHYYINDAEIVEYYSPGYLVKHAYLAALLYNRSRYAAFQKQYPDVGGYYTALYAEDAKGWENAKRAMLAIRSFYNLIYMIYLKKVCRQNVIIFFQVFWRAAILSISICCQPLEANLVKTPRRPGYLLRILIPILQGTV